MKIFGYRNRWKVTPGHHPSPQHFPCTVIAWVAVRFAGCGKQVGTAPVRRAVHCQCRSPDDFHHNFKALHVMKCPDIKFQSVSNYTKCTWISFEVVLLRHRLWQVQGEESYIIRKDCYILVIIWEKKRRYLEYLSSTQLPKAKTGKYQWSYTSSLKTLERNWLLEILSLKL